MADGLFGDPELFAEFEKPREPSDRLLLETIKSQKEAEPDKITRERVGSTEEDKIDHAKFMLGASDEESESDTGHSVNNEQSDNEYCMQESPEGKYSRNGVTEQDKTIKRLIKDHHPLGDNRGQVNFLASDLQREVERLKKENTKLRRQRRIIEPSRFEDDDGPALQIIYMNHKLARRHKTEIEAYLTNLFKQDEEREYEGKILVPNIRSNSVCLVDEAENELDVEVKTHNIMACTAINCTQLYQDFIVDAVGWPLVEGNPSLSEGWEHPLYSQVYAKAVPYDEDEDDDGPGNPRAERPKKACFNCGEEHDLKDCLLPRDFNRINQRKREFMNAKAASQQPKLQRYIPDGKDQHEKKSERFKAGVISDNLREALGIRGNQLPPYIYQMRLLGYPPGHMMDAEVDESGISLFDKHGKEVSIDGEEDSEVDNRDTSMDSKPAKFDTNKLIRYPGFNVEIPEGVIDEHQRLGMPSMRPEHGIDVLQILLSQQNTSGTKRQLSDNGTPDSAKRQKTRHHSHNDEDLPQADRKKLKAKRSLPRESSPSIEELQEQSNLLQQELAKVGGDGGDMVVADSVGSEESEGEVRSSDGVEGDDNSTTENTSLSRQDTSLLNSFSDSLSTSLSMSHGTPIHKNSSGKKDSLPNPEKWRKDITEHIPFENLPGTTGNFERMNNLLDKHRRDKRSLTSKPPTTPKTSS